MAVSRFWPGLALVLPLLSVAALVGLSCWPDSQNGPGLLVGLALMLGPAGAFATVALQPGWRRRYAADWVDTGCIFLLISFALLTLMLCMQQALLSAREALESGPTLEALSAAMQVGNLIQLGADVAFDLFYSIGLGLLSAAAMLTAAKRKERLLGLFGLLLACGLWLLNLLSFPLPPAQIGLVDLGPLSLLWWIAMALLDAPEASPSSGQPVVG